MPIVNNLYQNDSWINKPHCMDESPPPLTIPILKPPPTPTTPQTDPTRRKSLALPPPPPPPFKKTNAIKRKSFCFSSTRRKTVDFSSLFRETTTKTGNSSVRPRSMDSLLPFPPPSVPPGSGIHEEKPLPAVPIESTVITPVSSPVTDDHFEPLTLKDITLILDRNDRMAAYSKDQKMTRSFVDIIDLFFFFLYRVGI
ncbi:hypothetical protein BC941DRAFT_445950 [Chlamydoabsidia padenii]|nr:hypothetical protein BC941DRAFT_445950 [Chlamydoabsidia padenii]